MRGAAGLALLMTIAIPSLVMAQPAKPSSSSGIPQLSGILEQRGRGNTPPADWVGALTTRAKAIIAAFDEFAAPKYDCVAATSPRVIDETLYNVRIDQLPDRVNLYYGKTTWFERSGSRATAIPSQGPGNTSSRDIQRDGTTMASSWW